MKKAVLQFEKEVIVPHNQKGYKISQKSKKSQKE